MPERANQMTPQAPSPGSDWRNFVDGPLYLASPPPWFDDPAYSLILAEPGLRDSLGGPVSPALRMACELVRALTEYDVVAHLRNQQHAQGLCLGFGSNLLEPYDLLRALPLGCVHACEWIGEHLVEAATMLQSLSADDPSLVRRIRLHQATIAALSFLNDATIQVIYTANMFTWEVPMQQKTFDLAIEEMMRVMTPGGVIFSKGSAGELERRLTPHGRMLLPHQPITVFQKPEH